MAKLTRNSGQKALRPCLTNLASGEMNGLGGMMAGSGLAAPSEQRFLDISFKNESIEDPIAL
jgi:hypothetical protein